MPGLKGVAIGINEYRCVFWLDKVASVWSLADGFLGEEKLMMQSDTSLLPLSLFTKKAPPDLFPQTC